MNTILTTVNSIGIDNLICLVAMVAVLGLANGVRLSLNHCKGRTGRIL